MRLGQLLPVVQGGRTLEEKEKGGQREDRVRMGLRADGCSPPSDVERGPPQALSSAGGLWKGLWGLPLPLLLGNSSCYPTMSGRGTNLRDQNDFFLK